MHDDGPLQVPFDEGLSRWGAAAQALAEQVGGRWPRDAAAQLALCQLVHLRSVEGRNRWVVDDVTRFAAAAGAKVAGGFVQPTLGLDVPVAPR